MMRAGWKYYPVLCVFVPLLWAQGAFAGANERAGRRLDDTEVVRGADTAGLLPSADKGYPKELVEGVGRELERLGTYTVDFTAAAEEMEPVKGRYVVDGNRFYIGVGGRQMFSDGVTRWQVSHYDREVTVDAADTSSRNILVNPVRAFDLGDDSFDAEYAGEDFLGGRMCRAVKLTPKGEMSDMAGEVILYIDMETGLPAGLRYIMDDDRLLVTVVRISGTEKVDAGLFSFDPERYDGYEVIDFR